MWWHDLLWGVWNGFTAWIVLVLHVLNIWENQPFYDIARNGNWYDLGFLVGAGSPLLGSHQARSQRTRRSRSVNE